MDDDDDDDRILIFWWTIPLSDTNIHSAMDSFHCNKRINLWLFSLRCVEHGVKYVLDARKFQSIWTRQQPLSKLHSLLSKSYFIIFEAFNPNSLPRFHSHMSSTSATNTVERAQIRDATESSLVRRLALCFFVWWGLAKVRNPVPKLEVWSQFFMLHFTEMFWAVLSQWAHTIMS